MLQWKSVVLAVLACSIFVNCNLFEAVPNAFYKDCLLEINKYRKLHGAHSLRWSNDLQYHAQSRAEKLALDEYLQNEIETLDSLGQGETVSYLSSAKPMCRTFPPSGDCYACRDTIATWYNESKYYNYLTGYSLDGQKQVLHFTQLVWKDTVRVGLATALSPQYGVITVARYHPRGNVGFLDEYVRNVAPRGAGGNDGFDADGENGGQGGPACRKLKKIKAIIKEPNCTNVYGDDLCDFYAERFRGYCKYNEVFMKENCAKSCGVCEVSVRFPSPPKKLGVKWQIGKWLKCRGGFQSRSVRCYYKDSNGHNFLVQNKFCKRELGEKPAKYQDCLLS